MIKKGYEMSKFDDFKVGNVRQTIFPMTEKQREMFAAIRNGEVSEEQFVQWMDLILAAFIEAAAEEAVESYALQMFGRN